MRALFVALIVALPLLAGCAGSAPEALAEPEPSEADRTTATNVTLAMEFHRTECRRFLADTPVPAGQVTGYVPEGFEFTPWPADPTGSLGVMRFVAHECLGPDNQTIAEHFEMYLVEPTTELARQGAQHAVLGWAVVGSPELASLYGSWGFELNGGEVTVGHDVLAGAIERGDVFADSGTSSTRLQVRGLGESAALAGETQRWFSTGRFGGEGLQGIIDVDWGPAQGRAGEGDYQIQTAGVVVLAGAGDGQTAAGPDMSLSSRYVPLP